MTRKSTFQVLIIDDEYDLRQTVGMVFKSAGWDVLEAANGRQGLEQVINHMPDLMLLDLMMPEMTGIEFCHKLLGELHLFDTPVLMISAVNPAAKLIKDFQQLPLSHKDFLHKPFSTEQLIKAIKGVMPQFEPAEEPPPLPPPPKPADPAETFGHHLKGYRILVIDDEPDILMIIKSSLGLFHEIVTAHNGMEGLEALERTAPDFVITDVNMPVLNGLETAEAIRHHPVFGTIPIFFLTGETDANLPRKVYDVGGNLFLRKPVDPKQLLKLIDHFVVEADIRPGHFKKLAEAAPKAPPPQPKPEAPKAPTVPVRAVIMDASADRYRIFKRLLERAAAPRPGMPGIEILWCEDLHLGLGNLARWQPDLILFNTNCFAGMDGVAFGQTLLLQKMSNLQEVVFTGLKFAEIENSYSRNHYKREPIKVDDDEAKIAAALGEALDKACQKVKPKKLAMDQLHEEEVERMHQTHQRDTRQAVQQQMLRQQYSGIQQFIDSQFK